MVLQPRRRDFTRSSQGLAGLGTTLLAAQTMEELSYQCPIVPRDPSSALPHPHQRPTTAATCPPSTSGRRFQHGFGHTSRLGFEPEAQGGFCHGPGQSFEAVGTSGWPRGLTVDTAWPCCTAHLSNSVSPEMASGMHNCIDQSGDHNVCPAQCSRHQAAEQLDANTSLGRSKVWPVAWQQHGDVERCHTGMRLPGAGMQQAVLPPQLQAQHQAELTQRGWSAGMHLPHAEYQTWSADTGKEPCHAGSYSREPLLPRKQLGHQQQPGSCFDWSGCQQGNEQNRRGPACQAVQSREGSQGPKAATSAYGDKHTRPNGPQWSSHRSTHQEEQKPVEADIAAMEAVLSDYRALRSQIADAGAQLALCQERAAQDGGRWLPDRLVYAHCTTHDGQHQGSVHSAAMCHSRNTQVAELTDTLKELKAAAAKQRPVIEAVASHLRSQLSRVHA